MKFNILILAIVASILLFGCAGVQIPGLSNTQTNSTASVNTSVKAETAANEPVVKHNAVPEQKTEAEVKTEVKTTTSTVSPPSVSGGTSMTWAQVKASGYPLQCNYAMQQSGKSVSGTLYFSNKQTRLEYDQPANGNEKCTMITVIKSTGMGYWGCKGQKVIFLGFVSNYDWMEAADQTTSLSGDFKTATSKTTVDYRLDSLYNSLSSGSLSCNSWVADSTKFDTNGNVYSYKTDPQYANAIFIYSNS